MAKYIHIDSLNMFFRSVHTVNPNNGIDLQTGMALHTIFNSIRKVWRKFGGDQILFHEEGRSWRKDFDPTYKLNRKIAAAKKTEKEIEDQEILLSAFNDMSTFFKEKTNVAVLRCPVAEADDTIAVFIQEHPEDEHIIISSDSDFVQLLKHPNVRIFNGVTDYTYHQSGIQDAKGRNCAFNVESSSKIKIGKPDESFEPEDDWYKFALFLKCIRGDSSDNVFSAFPGARLKGTKNKIGIKEAYEDKDNQGFKWNNFMLSRWDDHEGNEQVVRERYLHNKNLIDLECQPDDIKEKIKETISECLDREPVRQVGLHFMKFCGMYDLNQISNSAQEFGTMLNSRVKED